MILRRASGQYHRRKKRNTDDRTIHHGCCTAADRYSNISVLQFEIDLNHVIAGSEADNPVAAQMVCACLRRHDDRSGGGQRGPCLFLALRVTNHRMHHEIGCGSAIVKQDSAADGSTSFQAQINRCGRAGVDCDFAEP